MQSTIYLYCVFLYPSVPILAITLSPSSSVLEGTSVKITCRGVFIETLSVVLQVNNGSTTDDSIIKSNEMVNETTRVFTTNPLTLADSGTTFHCLLIEFGLRTREITISVIKEATATTTSTNTTFTTTATTTGTLLFCLI